jgi:phosphoribosylaminoimidazole (AIR) synthetase
MATTFNMGIGFCLVTDPGAAAEVIKACGHDASVIGKIAPV